METLTETPTRATSAGETVGLGALRLRDFRNFRELDLELPPDGVAIVGPNGSGKTNLLEAIYYLEIFRSFRGAPDAELIRFGEDVFRVEAELRGGGAPGTLAAAYQRSGRRKKVEVAGREASRLGDAIGRLGAVIFSLEDVEIVRGSPSSRRRFLDILLSLVAPGYLDALQRYRSVLSQRNEALREGAPDAVVEPWTEAVVAAGSRIMEDRVRWVALRREAFGRYHAEIAGGTAGWLEYEPSVGGGAAESGGRPEEDAEGSPERGDWAERFRAALSRSRERERRRGVTVVGPHRDDVSFRATLGGAQRNLRSYGSGGQQRTAALALRLVEADSLRERLGREPIYLLDDVFAELDPGRSERLVRLMDEGRQGQVVLTTPKRSEVGLRGRSLAEWQLADGRLETA